MIHRLRATPMSTTLISVQLLLFAVELLLGGPADEAVLLRMGAVRADRVAQGELYRLISAELLHGGWLHLLLNLAAFWALARLVERLFGGARLLSLFVCGAIGASLAGVSAGGWRMSVGSSGAIMGMAGALLVACYITDQPVRGLLSARLRRPLWVLILLTFPLGLVLELFYLPVDHLAHAGGLLSGALFALVGMRRSGTGAGPVRDGVGLLTGLLLIGATLAMLVDGPEALRTLDADLASLLDRELHEEPAAGLRGGLGLAELGWRWTAARGEERAAEQLIDHLPAADPEALSVAGAQLHQWGLGLPALVVLEHSVQRQPEDATALNQLAWHLLQGPVAPDPQRALRLADRALAAIPEEDRERRAATLDTLALAYARAGELGRARRSQEQAVRLAREVSLPSLPQLEDRLWAYRAGITPARASPAASGR